MKTKISLVALATVLSMGASFAADLPSRKAPVVIPPPPPPLWTGFYAGVNAGVNLDGNSNTYVYSAPVFLNGNPIVFPTASATSAAAAAAGTGWLQTNNTGFLGGGQVGYNYQFGAGGLGWGSGWLAGIEADIQGVAGSSGNRNFSTLQSLSVPPFIPGFAVFGSGSASKSLDYIGTVRGRIGFLINPTLLIYGTGGLAYGGASSSTNLFQSGAGPVPFFGPTVTAAWGTAGSYSNTRVGWTAGGGLEWLFLPNWSAKLEYLYYDLGSATYSSGISGSFVNIAPTPGQPFFLNGSWTTARFDGHIIRAGVNYHFNWAAPAPVLAKY